MVHLFQFHVGFLRGVAFQLIDSGMTLDAEMAGYTPCATLRSGRSP
jgi:hypothetical protein